MFAGLVRFFLITFKHTSLRLANFHFEPTLKQHHFEILQIKWGFLKYQIRKFTVKVLKLVLRKKENKKKRIRKNIKISVFTINVNEISKKYMIILQKHRHQKQVSVV